MLTACRKIACRAKGIKKYQGFCEQHKTESGWYKRQQNNGNRHQRGYGKQWDKIRVVALKRDQYLCVLCKDNSIITAATTVDHILAKAFGGSDDLNNLQSLCDACHKHKTATERLI